MIKLTGLTPDIAKENIEQLKTIFPDVFTEGKVDFDKLKQVLGEYVDDSKERYNFTWNGKGKALRIAQTPSAGTLRPCKEESKDWDTTKNLYIEGDNLEVLKLLQKSYYGKVKMIYIDPPYNTGKDFIYPDDFSNSIEHYKVLTGQVDAEGQRVSTNSESNGRYHTDWLNMMYSRIRLARNLLTDDGAIFISIDDNEVDNLKKLCSEIFGEENFIGQLVIINNLKGRNSKENMATCHEYLLIYGKSDFTANGLPMTDEQKAAFDKTDENGNRYQLRDLRKRGGPDNREDRPKMFFPVYYNEATKECSLEKHKGWIEVLPIKGDGSDGRWRWGQEKVVANLSILEPKYSAIAGRWGIEHRVYLNPSLNPVLSSEETDDDGSILEERSSKSKSFWMGGEISNDAGKRQFKELMKNTAFDYPKAVEFLSKIVYMGSNDSDYILDFFSGSATTAHAIMQLNALGATSRKFIMVQLPEQCEDGSEPANAGFENICEIGKERIRRAGEKIKAEAGLMGQNLDIGFKVFKLDSSNLYKWQPDHENLEQSLLDSISNHVDGRTEIDVVYEIMLKMGIDLTYPVEEHDINGKKVYSVGFGALMMCLDDEITTEVASGMVQLKTDMKPETWKVVFKDNGFASDSVKTNVKEILKCAGLDEDAFATV